MTDFYKSPLKDFTKIRPVGAALMYTDGQTGRRIYGGRTDMLKLMDAFRDGVSAPKKATKFVW